MAARKSLVLIGSQVRQLPAGDTLSGVEWGGIEGDLAEQADLVAELAGKLSLAGGTMQGALNNAPPASLAAANALNLLATNTNTITITAGLQLRTFGEAPAGTWRRLVFAANVGIATGSLILPGNTNIAARTGDVADFESVGGNVWRCISYLRADGSQLDVASKIGGINLQIGSLSITSSGSGSYTNGGTYTDLFAPVNGAKRAQLRMKCVNAEHGFLVGTELLYPINFGCVVGSTHYGVSADVYAPGTSGTIVISIATGGIPVVSKTTKAIVALTPANWRMSPEFATL